MGSWQNIGGSDTFKAQWLCKQQVINGGGTGVQPCGLVQLRPSNLQKRRRVRGPDPFSLCVCIYLSLLMCTFLFQVV